MRFHRAWAAACAAVVLGPAALFADRPPFAVEVAPSRRETTPSSPKASSTLGRLAQRVAGQVSAASPEASSALARLTQRIAGQVSAASPEPPLAVHLAGESTELGRAFATLLLSELALRKLGPTAVSAPSPEAAEAIALKGGARSLLRLSVGLNRGDLQAKGDLVSLWVNFWSGRSSGRSGRGAAVIFAAVEADAQALALAPELPPVAGAFKLEGARFADLPQWTAAIAAGDLDGDGRDEVVALTNDEIFAFSPEGRLLARRDHRPLGDSGTPCREPFGAISIQSQRIAYFSASRRQGEVLSLDAAHGAFRSLGSLNEAPLASQGQTQIWGSFVPGHSAFAADLRLGSGETWSVRGPLWTLSLFAGSKGLRSLIAFADGTASWFGGVGIPRGRPFRSSAAGIALIDIDGDGEPEIVTTSSRYRADPDELRILESPAGDGPAPAASAATDAATDATQLRERWHEPIRGGWALQVAAAHLAAGKPAQILVGVWRPDGSAELQIFRKVPR